MTNNQVLSENIAIGNFSLKIDINEPLTLDVLISELSGINALLGPLSAFASKMEGKKIRFESAKITQIEEGSILLNGVSYIASSECITTAKELINMEWAEIIKILTLGGLIYGGKRLIDCVTPRKNTDGMHIETHGDNSPIMIGKEVAKTLKPLFKGKDEIIDRATNAMAEVEAESPKTILGLQKATNMVARPNGILSGGVTFIGENEKGEKELPIPVFSQDEIKAFPDKFVMPKEIEKESRKIEKNILMKLISMNLESKAKDAWKVKIEEEGYSKKTLPLEVDNEEDREKILTMAPHPFLADVEIISTCKEGEDPVSQRYIIKKLCN